MARLRLGVALLLPMPVAAEVDGLRRALGDRSRERIPPHVTLVPPVNVRSQDLGRALAVLRSAAAATPPVVTVTLDPPTSFLPANPVVYLPVTAVAVEALRRRVWEAPLTRTLSWPFVPHVTLADDIPPDRIAAAVAALASFTASVTFDRVSLLVEHRPGPQWRPLADAAFGPPAVVARGGPLAVTLDRSHQVDPEAQALLSQSEVDLAVPPTVLRGPLVVTARREGEVVGVAAGWIGGDGYQSSVFVAPAHRRQGIGRHLASALASAVADAAW